MDRSAQTPRAEARHPKPGVADRFLTAAVRPIRFRSLPPAGEALLPAALASLRSRQDTATDLETTLAERFGVGRVDLCISGREALRVALTMSECRTDRSIARINS